MFSFNIFFSHIELFYHLAGRQYVAGETAQDPASRETDKWRENKLDDDIRLFVYCGNHAILHYYTHLVMGVRGAAVRHITTSLTAMFTTNSDMPVCRTGFLAQSRRELVF